MPASRQELQGQRAGGTLGSNIRKLLPAKPTAAPRHTLLTTWGEVRLAESSKQDVMIDDSPSHLGRPTNAPKLCAVARSCPAASGDAKEQIYFAHSEKRGGCYEPLRERLRFVAERAARYASSFGCADQSHAIGLLHDLGKYADQFQRRVRGDPNEPGKDHWRAGAAVLLYLRELRGLCSRMNQMSKRTAS